jgi:3-dehydroquinate synthase
MESLVIKSGQGDYCVEFLAELRAVAEAVRGIARAVLIVDRMVAELYRDDLAPALEQLPVLLLDATEDEKTLGGVIKVATWLQEQGCTKQSAPVAIGGGIIQDIVAFSAHVYYRGLRWAYVPTTLLSMSDSCIGAKCCINLNTYKNQLGAFHAPTRVLLCPRFTDTLSDPDVASGYGEILKLMWTGSGDLFRRLKASVNRGGLRNADLGRLTWDCLAVKKSVIEVDEYETSLRRILNYGHTFGHALEGLTRHEVPHGLAVAWGMDLVNYLAVQRGLLAEADFWEMHGFIRKHLAFRLTQPVQAADLIRYAKRDKKVADGHVHLVLAAGPGRLQVVKTPFDALLEQQITDYVAGPNVYAAPCPLPGQARRAA